MDPRKQSIDLEKELTCSICTELLYQPLTLLDCLHTFCGACLKEWFRFQAATAEKAQTLTADSTPFTCPSCRSPVRDTKHNATVVTLLDMFVAAHPNKGRPESDKEEMAKKYKPGDQILPKLNIRQRTAEERRAHEEDQRLLNEVREMSVRDAVGLPLPTRPRRRGESNSADERPTSSGEQSEDAARQRRIRERQRRSESHHRQVEHQSSLRSLIGSADMSERDIEKEIEEFARQIQEEGLLDGLDLDNIDLNRDDELSRRITEAYRRRQRERSRQEPARRSNVSVTNGTARQSAGDSRHRNPDNGSRTRGRPNSESRSISGVAQSEDRSRPPTSLPSNLEVQNPTGRTRRRTASGSRSATAPVFASDIQTRPATRSQTDLTLMSQASESPRPSLSEDVRSSSTPSVPPSSQAPASSLLPGSNGGGNASFASRVPLGNPTPNVQSTPNSPDPNASWRPSRLSPHRPADLAIVHSAVSSPASSPTSHGHQRTRSQLYPEPSISCSRCNKPHIEYEVHYNCGFCSNGQWNMCLDCYRRGKGCLYWFGFGYGAWNKWEKARQQDKDLAVPHMLTANRYIPPPSTPGGADGRKTLTTDDPRARLETGTFCAGCFTWTNSCFWRCDVCNEGDWGFCNDCVNQGRSCTHMLLPLTHEAAPVHPRPRSPRSPSRPSAAAVFTGPQASNIGPFKPLTFNTRCDVCQEAIPPSQTRYHCSSCTSTLVDNPSPGDYDICSPCYGNLVTQGRISIENGHAGWRRCLKGHRIVTVGFADGKIGQWRYVERDLVGGRVMRAEPFENPESREQVLQKWSWQQGDEKWERLVCQDVSATAPSTLGSETYTQSLPPDGGLGWKGGAKWAWYPQAGAQDELSFPKGAEIREIEDVNGDWFFGTYMGSKGLFPAPYVRLEPN